MSFLLDKYCRSSLHLSESIRDTMCANWDKEHPGEKDGGDGKPAKESPSKHHNDPPSESHNDPPSPPNNSRNDNAPPPRNKNVPNSDRNAPSTAPARPPVEAAAVDPSAATPSNTSALPANTPAPTTPQANQTPVGGDPFPEAQVQGQAPSTAAGSRSSPTALIVGTVCAAMFAVLLVAAFVVYKRRQTRQAEMVDKRMSGGGGGGIEDGIFEVVPKGPNTDFTFEDFSAAPTGLYEREAITPPPVEQHAVDDEDDVMREVDAITRGTPRIITANLGRNAVPEETVKTPWGSKDLIFASPYAPTDTGYHIADEHVYGAPVYGVPRVGVSGVGSSGVSAYTPNAAAVAAAVVSAVQGTANVVRVSGGKKNINGIPTERRHSMEWPAEFDDPEDDPLGLANSTANTEGAVVDLGYGANMVDEVEEFPDVPRVDPNDPRLHG